MLLGNDGDRKAFPTLPVPGSIINQPVSKPSELGKLAAPQTGKPGPGSQGAYPPNQVKVVRDDEFNDRRLNNRKINPGSEAFKLDDAKSTLLGKLGHASYVTPSDTKATDLVGSQTSHNLNNYSNNSFNQTIVIQHPHTPDVTKLLDNVKTTVIPTHQPQVQFGNPTHIPNSIGLNAIPAPQIAMAQPQATPGYSSSLGFQLPTAQNSMMNPPMMNPYQQHQLQQQQQMQYQLQQQQLLYNMVQQNPQMLATLNPVQLAALQQQAQIYAMQGNQAMYNPQLNAMMAQYLAMAGMNNQNLMGGNDYDDDYDGDDYGNGDQMEPAENDLFKMMEMIVQGGLNYDQQEAELEERMQEEEEKAHEQAEIDQYTKESAECPCCRGYTRRCYGDVCRSLGECHCVVRREKEDEVVPPGKK